MVAFEGIPYAQPPVGSLRWRPPQAAHSWSGVRDATHFGPPCVQVGDDASTVVGEEDCLSLNWYIPLREAPTTMLPIVVDIHGGSLTSGGSMWENMRNFVAHAGGGDSVMAVTINYRLNVLGYLATSDLTHEQSGSSGNYGFLDQQLALRWIRDNARVFGGDPHRVTLYGQSSGGTSIFALMSSPASRGLFQVWCVLRPNRGCVFLGLIRMCGTNAGSHFVVWISQHYDQSS